MWLWHNGEMKMEMDAVCAANSAGTLLGWGVFTTIGVWLGRPFALERHLTRLRSNAETLEIALDWNDDFIADGLHRVLQTNEIQHGHARITLTQRGDGRWNHAAGSELLILAQESTQSTLDNPKPLKLTLSPFRLDVRRPLAGIKSTSYAEYLRIFRDAQNRGFDEAVICTGQGILSECARSNLFWARDGVLYTPSLSTGCLPGIARELILEWCARDGVKTKDGAFSLFDLTDADEVFLTNAATGPRALASLSWNESGETVESSYAAPGSLTKQMQSLWEAAILAN